MGSSLAPQSGLLLVLAGALPVQLPPEKALLLGRMGLAPQVLLLVVLPLFPAHGAGAGGAEPGTGKAACIAARLQARSRLGSCWPVCDVSCLAVLGKPKLLAELDALWWTHQQAVQMLTLRRGPGCKYLHSLKTGRGVLDV